MNGHGRTYPRKPRKPEETDANKVRKRQRRAHKRIAKARYITAVHTWEEHKKLTRILNSLNQPAMTDYLPRDDEKPEKEKDLRVPDDGF